MTEELFLISDVAKRLAVPPHRVAYLFMTRTHAGFPSSALVRAIFTLGDAKRVAKALGKNWDETTEEVHQ